MCAQLLPCPDMAWSSSNKVLMKSVPQMGPESWLSRGSYRVHRKWTSLEILMLSRVIQTQEEDMIFFPHTQNLDLNVQNMGLGGPCEERRDAGEGKKGQHLGLERWLSG